MSGLKLLSGKRRFIALFASGVAVIATYFLFDYHLESTGREVITSWLQSEATAIQEGNLLSSISKNQRVLLSSRFIRGIRLFDLSSPKETTLIEIGQSFSFPNDLNQESTEKLEAITVGFLHKKIAYRIPNRKDLLLVFDIESAFLRNLFFSSLLFFLLFVVVLLYSVRSVERRESALREHFLKQALNDFIREESPSDFVKQELPVIVQWWAEKKSESDRLRTQEIENQSAIYLGEIATRVAHDIRSPLNTVNAIEENIRDLIPSDASALLQGAIDRIRAIANGISEHSRAVSASRQTTNHSTAQVQAQITEVLISHAVQEIISEKKVQIGDNRNFLNFVIQDEARFAVARANPLEFRRSISNLLDNAIEATTESPQIDVSLELCGADLLLTIRDNGRGIPQNLLPQIGARGFTFGKERGSGLGLYYAKKAILHWNGRFILESNEGKGTSVKIWLPRYESADFRFDIRTRPGSTIVAIDDDPSNHSLLQNRFGDFLIENDISIEHFFDADSFRSWFMHNRNSIGNLLVLSDYQLQEGESTGLDLIEEFKLSGRAILLTNSFDEPGVIERSRVLNVPIIPKPLIPYVPIFPAET